MLALSSLYSQNSLLTLHNHYFKIEFRQIFYKAKLTNWITGKSQYISRKLVVGQSPVHNKTISYLKHIKIKYWWQTFFKTAKCFTRQCFSIWNFTHNIQETYLFHTNCYFVVIYEQFLCYIAVLCNNITSSSQQFNKCLCFSPVMNSL